MSVSPPSSRHWYMVAVLTFGYYLSFLDRGSLTLLVGPIERDLHINDFEMSLLLGLAFGALYAFCGIPFGMLADRVNRRKLIIFGVTLWSAATLLCGFATSYGYLFIGRMGVGVGEAALAPAATSMINDAVPALRRGRAFAVFATGSALGGASASLLGGLIIALVARHGEVTLPLVGAVASWQLVLIIIGLAGIPLVLALLSVREPARQQRDPAAGPRPGLGATLRYMARNRRIYAPIFGATMCSSLGAYSFYAWAPTFFVRSWGVDRPHVGLYLGTFQLVLAVLGINLAGYAMDRLAARGSRRGAAAVGAACMGILGILAPLISLMPSLDLTWIVVAGYIAFLHAALPAGLNALTQVTPRPIVATVAALHFMWTGLIGLSLGPTIVVLLADGLFSGPQAIGRAISVVAMTVAWFGVMFYLLLRRSLKDHVAPTALDAG